MKWITVKGLQKHPREQTWEDNNRVIAKAQLWLFTPRSVSWILIHAVHLNNRSLEIFLEKNLILSIPHPMTVHAASKYSWFTNLVRLQFMLQKDWIVRLFSWGWQMNQICASQSSFYNCILKQIFFFIF